eukprot:15458372-Alexandrium_andersonii.AAC.1
MPPKRKDKAPSGAPALKKARSSANLGSSSTDGGGSAAGINASLIVKVEEAKTKILAHPIFADLAAAAPIGFGGDHQSTEKGFKAAFNSRAFKQGIESHKMYESANSIMVLGPYAYPSKSAPIPQTKMKWLQDHYWAKPRANFPYSLVGALRSGESPTEVKGSIEMLSPPELLWAAFL